jgi:K(+)-stimulated pyrophosphate-energized sodium pump
VVITYVASYLLIPELGDGTLWWKLSTIITCGTLAGAIIPEVIKIFTSTNSAHVRECVEASKEGGASLNVLAGLTAGNFSAYWMGLVIVGLMGIAYLVSLQGLGATMADGHPLMLAPAVFAFGLVAFGFLGMGPVTIAVDSYGPVTDNAQSVYELSLIETVPEREGRRCARSSASTSTSSAPRLPRGERRRRQHLQGDGQAGADRHRGGRRDDR